VGLKTEGGVSALVEGGLEPQARKALENVGTLLAGRGLTWDNVVKTTVFLIDMADYGTFNEIYVAALGDHRPARSLVAVAGLPLGALVEIEAWAYVPE
jgi:2-iminobutanoate/2-iminopropanoate deaminase